MLTRTFGFRLTSTGDGYSVRLTCDTARPPVSAPFYFDLNPTSRLNQVVKAIGDGSVTYDNLREVGAILFTALLYGDVRERFLLERKEAEKAAGQDPLRFVLRHKPVRDPFCERDLVLLEQARRKVRDGA